MVSRVPDRSTLHLDTLDIAITSRCNLACKHCYQGFVKNRFEIPYHRIVAMLDEGLKVGLNHVVITGGEPLTHPDIKKILMSVKDRLLFTTLLSNGTLLSEMPWIVDYTDEAIISLDDFEEIHDKIRGRGNWKKTVKGIKMLIDAGIPVMVSTQITKTVMNRFKEYTEFLNNLGVHQLNLIPTAAFAYTLQNYVKLVDDMDVHALQDAVDIADFLIGVHASEEDCTALYWELSVNFDGVVYPCHFFRSMNQFSVGNIYYQTIDEIYNHWKDLPALKRDRKKLCGSCPFYSKCMGGCKARAFAYFGTVNAPDPLHCALLFKKDIEDVVKQKIPTVYHAVLGVKK